MERTGVRSFKADELALIREVAQVYGDLLKEISHADFKRAYVDRVIRKAA